MQPYDYIAAGFDNFLSRSIDDVSQTNLDASPPRNMAVAFDRNQISGPMGDTLQVGRVRIDGANERIILNDGENDRLLLGRDDGGF